MRLKSFRIKNFRSIIDSEWCDLSLDNITGLIGQNESGKTSILEALHSFFTGEVSNDYLRSDGSYPEISCSFETDSKKVLEKIPADKDIPKSLLKEVDDSKRINLVRTWDKDSNKFLLEEEKINSLFDSLQAAREPDTMILKNTTEQSDQPEDQAKENKPDQVKSVMTKEGFVNFIFGLIPKFELFEDFSSLLPDTIDLEDIQNNNSNVQGFKGAQNLLSIAGVDLDFLQNSTLRIVENQIERINKKITTDFREFWSQKVGKVSKISIEFELKHHDVSAGDEKKGKPYLVFWIVDGQEKLYPKQRSKGVRWFLSFYLQLKASAGEDSTNGQVFLIDEPGGSLHPKAQEDVLKVFEQLKDKIQVIYTTHSPYLISLNTIYRLLAVQRADEEDDKSETLILDTNQLGSATSDTLSPLYTLMGARFSDQQAIKKDNNVILEEISAFYYLKAFWKLVNSRKDVNFLPATGTSNVPQLSYLFLGWGLNFAVVLDDDSSGRAIYNELKRNLFLDDVSEANKRLMKIQDCDGIEDIFSHNDFSKHVLDDKTLNITSNNSKYVKDNNISKPVIALKLMLKVKNNKLSFRALEKQTKDNIANLVKSIEKLL